MPDESLLILLNEVREKTLRVLNAVAPHEATWAPPGLHNSILWHAGHAYILAEWLALRALGHEPQSPVGWFELFSWQSRPADVAPDRWPALADIVRHLVDQKHRLEGVLRQTTGDQLDGPSAADPRQTARRSIVHGLHDEACHCGEIYLLLKMQRARAR